MEARGTCPACGRVMPRKPVTLPEPAGPPMVEPHQIKALRLRLDMTQDALAKALGVKRVQVARWEANLAQPRRRNLAVLRRFAAQRGVEL